MNLKFDQEQAFGYRSKTQIARVLTELWVGNYVYCPNCGHSQLKAFENNNPVGDFFCSACQSQFELKSKSRPLGNKVADGAFATMIERINASNNPSFFFLHYHPDNLVVNDLVAIPKHFFTNQIIEKRPPLAPTARRAGWVGCNILLNTIPQSGKIYLIKNGVVESKAHVLKKWKSTRFLGNQSEQKRGWVIEVLKAIEMLPNIEFSLKEVYAFEDALKAKYPQNGFIKDKIRQQLQLLRDQGLVEFKGRGHYRKLF